MKKWIVIVAMAFVLLLAACGRDEATQPPQESEPGTPSPVVSEVPPETTPEVVQTPSASEEEPDEDSEVVVEIYCGPVNPLTGLPMEEELVNDRPVAVMLNNIKDALPQQGVAQADIIYEVLAEGGVTRMLGVYQSVDGVGTIGSVRSARTYYLELALGHDAVFLHAGGSPDAYNKISAWNVTSLDCVNGPYEGSLFWRDSDRLKIMSREHTVVTSGEKIQELFPKYSFRKEHPEEYTYDVHFAQNGTPLNGTDAGVIEVPYSSYKTGVFTYDEELGKYLVEEYGKAYVDGNTGEQVAVTNVLILKTDCSVIPGDTAGRITVDLNSGEGWFACGGKIVPIRWSKDGVNAPLVYTLQDGSPLELGAGTSYVNIIPLSRDITVK